MSRVVNKRRSQLALTGSQVQYGDLALITAGGDRAPTSLTNDPSQFASWTTDHTGRPVPQSTPAPGGDTDLHRRGSHGSQRRPRRRIGSTGLTLGDPAGDLRHQRIGHQQPHFKASYTDVQGMVWSSMVKPRRLRGDLQHRQPVDAARAPMAC